MSVFVLLISANEIKSYFDSGTKGDKFIITLEKDPCEHYL